MKKQNKPTEELSLKDIFRNVLEEARMVLPGIQALFGFQLVAVFDRAFIEISSSDKCMHMAALMLTICAIGCLMAPASYHRQVEHDVVSQAFIVYASKLLCIGMAPLLFSISLDTYVVCHAIIGNSVAAGVAALFSFSLLSTLWYIVPQAQKRFLRLAADKRRSENNADSLVLNR